jgi:hypothetical protein
MIVACNPTAKVEVGLMAGTRRTMSENMPSDKHSK